MPLSKARDRERKRLSRLENKGVQPTRLIMDKNRIMGVQPKQVGQAVTEGAVQPEYVIIGGVRYKKPKPEMEILEDNKGRYMGKMPKETK